MKKTFLFIAFITVALSSFSQNKDAEYKKKLLEKATKLYKEYNYVKAISVYEELEKLGSRTAAGRLGDCYRQMNDLVNAEFYYAKAIQQKNVRSVYYLYYAQALMSNEKYESAMNWLQVYQRKEPDSDKADTMLKACKKVLKTIEENSAFQLTNLEINGPAQDFAPYFYQNGIIFTSSRIEGMIRKKDMSTNTGYLDVYYSPLNWRDTIPGVSKIKGNVNTINFHDGPACVNRAQDKIFFTRNNYVAGHARESKSGDIKLKIYSAEKSGDGFKNLHELEFNGNEYSSAYPSINHNETVIYFSSDRAGGFGGTDIYYSTYNKEKKKWNRPKNAGPTINSEGNERFPFIHDSGSLYFASDGHMGFGGLDIFEAKAHDSLLNQFVSIENLGTPFNSSKDDFSYIVDLNEITGYFASNRDGGKGNDDIYMFTSATIPLDISVTTNDTANENTWITVYDIDKNITLDRNHTDENGNFYSRLQPSSNYMIIVKKQDFETIKYPIETPANEHVIDIQLNMLSTLPSASRTVPIDLAITTNDTANANTWITIYDIERNETLDRKLTDEKGLYHGQLLLNSNYMIIIKKKGFKTIKHPVDTPTNEHLINLSFNMEKLLSDDILISDE